MPLELLGVCDFDALGDTFGWLEGSLGQRGLALGLPADLVRNRLVVAVGRWPHDGRLRSGTRLC